MMEAKSKGAWWRRKRRWAALLLWWLVAYPLSIGPLCYAHTRGWLPPWVEGPAAIYGYPMGVLVVAELPPSKSFLAYLNWWDDVAERHAASG